MSKIKVVVVGDKGVGKTTLIYNAVEQEQNDSHGDALTKKVTYQKKDFEVKLIDTHGWEPGKMRSVDVFVICFSHDNEDSYLTIENWAKKVRAESPEATLILVGTKNDVEYDKEVVQGDFVKDKINAKLFLSVNQNDTKNLLEEIVRAREEDFDEELVTPGTENIADKDGELIEDEKPAKKPYSDKKRRLRGTNKIDTTPIRDFKKPHGIALDFMRLINNESFSDISLAIVDENQETYSVPCHRLVLAARSSVFRTMFFAEQHSEKQIILEGVHKRRALDLFIRFMYTDTLDSADQDITEMLIMLADKYQIGGLKIACGVFARDKITEETWLDVYNFAKKFNEATLAAQALEIPAALMPEIFESKSYMNLSANVLEELLARDDLCLDEKSIFDLICEWGTNREDEAKRLLKKIRLPLMGAKTLIEDIKGHKWIAHGDYLEAIEYFACPRLFKDKIKNDSRYRSRRGMCQFGWDSTGVTNVEISNFDKTIKKTGANNWDAMILSDTPLESGLQYWQIKIDVLNADKSGMAIGLTNERGLGYSNYSNCCSLNMSSGAYYCNTVDHNVYPTFNAGDIIGFVVDFQMDEIKIYHNGKLIYRGTQRPSQLSQIWAVVFLYYNGDQISLVDDIPMGDLVDE